MGDPVSRGSEPTEVLPAHLQRPAVGLPLLIQAASLPGVCTPACEYGQTDLWCISGESTHAIRDLPQQAEKTGDFKKINIKSFHSSYLLKIYTASRNLAI